MKFRRGKQLPRSVWYICRAQKHLARPETAKLHTMAPASRATGAPVALYQVGPAGKAGSKLLRAREISLTTPGLDLATKLRVFQRALRSRVDRKSALIDIVRAVNTSLEPARIAD